MPTLPEACIADLLHPYVASPPSADLVSQLGVYLDLLLRWNARTNLTAIRQPEEIVRRHFGESLFAAGHIQPLLASDATLLDFGSGAGFPGIPIQCFLPDLRVTLAESQGKKAAFLREVVRTLNLNTEVWPQRVESMPSNRSFDCVALRAVDQMDAALTEAQIRCRGGVLAALGGESLAPHLPASASFPIPDSKSSFLYLSR